ncbi:MAG: glycogen debranching enzyme N-terminal domain-containing protein [Bacteroidales bacterium]|nr:glycogen debranching enzyme N-terminal domain-containing protein [Bacteroidales bacterium]
MAYLKFNKAELVNLEYSLKREIITANRTGAYANTTIVGCNTRKYHCLLAVPVEEMNWRRHILLSTLDETLIQHGKSFNLGIHCYGDVYEPRGHKYIVDYENDPIPTVIYQVGGMRLQKEILMVQNEDRVLIRYTLLDCHSETTFRLKPFLAFRSIHSLTKCNYDADTHYRDIANGKCFKLYEALPYLNLQLSKEAEYVANPDWYFDIHYPEEQRRGFAFKEDLFVPGYFEMPLKKGESVVFSASTAVHDPSTFKRQFNSEYKKCGQMSDFDTTLRSAASRLFFQRSGRLEISSGFTWLGVGQLRDTMLCATGLTLHNNGDTKAFLKVVDDIIGKWKGAFVTFSPQAEAPLQLAVLMQDYASFTGDEKFIWNRYGKFLKEVIKSYVAGRPEAQLHGNGLLWTKIYNTALSWMDAYTEGHPVTERGGYQVEVNALWYNALRYTAEMERKFGKSAKQAKEYDEMADNTRENFFKMFWLADRRYLADYVDEYGQNTYVRPNQLFACCLPYSPIDEVCQHEVLTVVQKDLLTPRGIRTLSPKTPIYKGVYDGDQCQRDLAYHNGSTRPWLLRQFAMAGFKLYKEDFVRTAQNMIAGFTDDMTIHGIGAVAEIYDGDPAHSPHGAINSATSTAAILSIEYMIDQYNKEDK